MATNYIQLCYWKPQLNSIGWNISDDWKFFELFIFNTRLDKAQPNNRKRVRPKTTTTSKNLTSLKGREVLDVAFCRLRCQNIHTHNRKIHIKFFALMSHSQKHHLDTVMMMWVDRKKAICTNISHSYVLFGSFRYALPHYKDDVLKFIRTLRKQNTISILVRKKGEHNFGYVIQSRHTDWHRSCECFYLNLCAEFWPKNLSISFITDRFLARVCFDWTIALYGLFFRLNDD